MNGEHAFIDQNKKCMDLSFTKLPAAILKLLPSPRHASEYHICHFEELSPQQQEQEWMTQFNISFRLATTDEQGFKEWLATFETRSCTTWRVSKTFPNVYPHSARNRNTFKEVYRCQHNVMRPGVKTKHTRCSSNITATIKRVGGFSQNRESRANDVHLPHWPTLITLQYVHNHSINSPAPLRYRDVSEDVQKTLETSFRNGHSPSTALDLLKYDLQMEHGKGYVEIAADRAQCPDLRYSYNLYTKIFKENYGESAGEQMLNDLLMRIAEYNHQCRSNCAKLHYDKDSETLIIAICSPMSKRIHSLLKSSERMVFLDSSGNLDRHNCRIFPILTNSCVGGLPLGYMIMTSETKVNIAKGLEMISELAGDIAYGHRGRQGPYIAMTDDCNALRLALRSQFSEITLLLCVFHLLQAAWRWLFDSNHKISASDRPYLLKVLQSMVRATNRQELEDLYKSALDNPIVERNVNFKRYLSNLFARKEEWAMSYRSELAIQGNHTNNVSEAGVRVLKDIILERTKAFNVPQLFDFLTRRVDHYYERRILDIVNGRLDNAFKSKFLPTDRWTTIDKDAIIKVGDTEYEVPSASAKDSYYVNIEVGSCSCHVGLQYGPCKHMYAVIKHFGISSQLFIPIEDVAMKKLLLQIATGDADISNPEFFLPLRILTSSNPICVTEPRATVGCEKNETDNDRSESTITVRHICEIQPHEEDIDVARRKLSDAFHRIEDKLLSDPLTFLEPVKALLRSMGNITTDSSLISALHTFGKYHEGAAPLRTRIGKFKRGAQINVQPTSSKRRKKMNGNKSSLGGRKRLTPGAKAAFKRSAEHCYAKRIKSKRDVLNPPDNVTVPAPHCFSICVERNVAVGKNHSKK